MTHRNHGDTVSDMRQPRHAGARRLLIIPVLSAGLILAVIILLCAVIIAGYAP